MKEDIKREIEIRCLCCGKMLAVGNMPHGEFKATCSRCKTTNTFITQPKEIADLDAIIKAKDKNKY
jgi:phage FluMu protein Com